MSLKPEIILEWGDGEYAFALYGDQIEEIQHQCGKVGFGAIYQRVTLGVWFWGDLYHTIRLGLIGGGMGAVEAKRLTDLYIKQPLATGPNCPETVARAVMGAAMHGLADLKPSGEAETPKGS